MFAQRVAERERLHALGLRRLLYFHPMFIRARGEFDGPIWVCETRIPRKDVGDDEGVEVAYVRNCAGRETRPLVAENTHLSSGRKSAW